MFKRLVRLKEIRRGEDYVQKWVVQLPSPLTIGPAVSPIDLLWPRDHYATEVATI